MATRAQVGRAREWRDYLAVPRFKRRGAPPCVTCGGIADHFMAKGEPGYSCRHDPIRIDVAESKRV